MGDIIMNTFAEIVDAIKAYDTIIIHRHQRPDPDAIGSQVGLRDIIRENFPTKTVLATGQDEPTLAWLAQMNEVSDDDYANALVIVTDTANRPRVDDERYHTGQFLIKIDHHPNDDPYGDLMHVDTSALYGYCRGYGALSLPCNKQQHLPNGGQT